MGVCMVVNRYRSWFKELLKQFKTDFARMVVQNWFGNNGGSKLIWQQWWFKTDLTTVVVQNSAGNNGGPRLILQQWWSKTDLARVFTHLATVFTHLATVLTKGRRDYRSWHNRDHALSKILITTRLFVTVILKTK